MLNNLTLTRPLAVLDLETTGVNPQSDRIIEISVLKICPNKVKHYLSRRLNPGIPIPPDASAVHGIYDDDVANERSFSEFASELLDLLDGCDLCGFNIRRFDLRMLHAEFKRVGITFSFVDRAIIDPLQIFHKRERRDLPAAVQFYLGRQHLGAHSSTADVLATAEVLDAMLIKYEDLPREVSELHQHFKDPKEVDLCGRFIKVEGQVKFAFGKYEGQPLAAVAAKDPEYLRWILDKDFFDDTKSLVLESLSGTASRVITQQ